MSSKPRVWFRCCPFALHRSAFARPPETAASRPRSANRYRVAFASWSWSRCSSSASRSGGLPTISSRSPRRLLAVRRRRQVPHPPAERLPVLEPAPQVEQRAPCPPGRAAGTPGASAGSTLALGVDVLPRTSPVRLRRARRARGNCRYARSRVASSSARRAADGRTRGLPIPVDREQLLQ